MDWQRLIKDAVRLCAKEKSIVEAAIREEAERLGIVLQALTVCSNHVHLVYGYSVCSIEEVVRKFKKAGKLTLKKHGMMGKVWTAGYDKRFCFDEETLKNQIEYVNKHNDPPSHKATKDRQIDDICKATTVGRAKQPPFDSFHSLRTNRTVMTGG